LKGIPGENSYIDDIFPAIPLIPEAESIEKYYIYPKFPLISRRIYKGQINLPTDLINFIYLFIFFYLFEHIKTFVLSINQYAEEKLELKRRRNCELPLYNRYLNWKSLIIRKAYIFLKILILIDSNRKFKIEDY
jgi:hypothetical protein